MNFKDSIPIYLQIANRLCDEMLMGTHAERERIPSVREYSALIEVNVNTTMRSYDYLQQQEIIFNKRGIGYFVSEGATDIIKRLRHKEFVEKELPELFHSMSMLDISIEDIEELYRKFKSESDIS